MSDGFTAFNCRRNQRRLQAEADAKPVMKFTTIMKCLCPQKHQIVGDGVITCGCGRKWQVETFQDGLSLRIRKRTPIA